MNTPEKPDSSIAETLEATRVSAGAAGALAAGLLAKACRQIPEDANGPYMEVVRGLAQDLEKQLESLAKAGHEPAPVDALVDGALCCADLANLTACALPELPEERVPQAAAAAHLAIGAARAFGAGIEAGTGGLTEIHEENTLRDARGVSWRVGLATRQVEEATGALGR